ncbi:uncharacterized protein DS421_20g689340 [Arachis hypogaea]|nr:uncharacterized protein DS421_20g689340 [Arachis hypogaea]
MSAPPPSTEFLLLSSVWATCREGMGISTIPFDPTMRVLFSSLHLFLLPKVPLSLSVDHTSFSISISPFWIADVATAVQEVYVGYGSILLLSNLFLDSFSSFNFFCVNCYCFLDSSFNFELFGF